MQQIGFRRHDLPGGNRLSKRPRSCFRSINRDAQPRFSKSKARWAPIGFSGQNYDDIGAARQVHQESPPLGRAEKGIYVYSGRLQDLCVRTFCWVP